MEIKRIISSLKDFSFRKFDKRYTLFLTAFVISVLVKLVLFTIKVNGSVHFSSGIGDSPTLNFLLGYSIYVGVALFFAALGAFSKYFWPAFLLDLILDVWILANLLSLRFHGIMITGYDFRLIGNMNGFWDSLLAFIYFSDILMFLVTGAFIYIYIKLFKPFKPLQKEFNLPITWGDRVSICNLFPQVGSLEEMRESQIMRGILVENETEKELALNGIEKDKHGMWTIPTENERKESQITLDKKTSRLLTKFIRKLSNKGQIDIAHEKVLSSISAWVKSIKPHKRKWITGIVLLVISISLIFIKPLKFNELWGMPVNIFDQLNVSGEGMDVFATDYTIFMNLLADIYFCNSLDEMPKQEELTNEEKKEISKYMIEPKGKDTLRDNLLIIFVDSMEGWTLNTSINGQEITPNINALTKRNAIYTEKMYPMTQRGSSSDAQLMVNTGLLPLIYEATCYAYEGNFYYSIGDAMARLGSHNVMIVPTNPAAWNQSRISKPWGFPTMYGHDITDGELFEEVATLFDTIQEPFFIETVTMASHSPFNRSAHLSDLDIPEGLPIYKENYIRSLNYTDKCIGEFINKVKDNPKFERTTIVVLGDHCIFSSNREEFEESEIGRSLNANRYGGGYIPFIVSSPNNIKECREITNVSRQCDIYKTLLSILKLDNYPWRSFGYDWSTTDVGVWGSDADGYRLSERIIRNDYFRTLEEKK